MNSDVQNTIHSIKALIMKKGNCKDVFSLMCDLEFQLQKNFNTLTFESKSLQKQSNSYNSQIENFRTHNSIKSSDLQKQNDALRKACQQKDFKIMNLEMKNLQLDTQAIENKFKKNSHFSGSSSNAQFVNELETTIEALKKEVKVKDEIIKKLKSGGIPGAKMFTSELKNSQFGQANKNGEKLKGLNFDS